jgi:hypothetical protein
MSLFLLLALVLQLPEYRQRLAAIDAQLANGQTAQAAQAAHELVDAKVMANGQDLTADRWALAPISRGEPHWARLRELIASLAGAAPSAPAPRPELLAEIRAEQQIAPPAKGGVLAAPDWSQRPLLERIRHAVGSVLLRIGELANEVIQWLFEDGGSRPEQRAGTPRRVVGLLAGAVVVILVAVLGLAISSLRRHRVPAPDRRAERRREDDDPLSRTPSGWEARALELAAEGRAREAIRAWYHALLVRCYAAGLLHYRLGRTNWEYARALPPQVSWRPRFEELTRQFDLEWYGREQSTAEALGAFAAGAAEILRALGPAR